MKVLPVLALSMLAAAAASCGSAPAPLELPLDLPMPAAVPALPSRPAAPAPAQAEMQTAPDRTIPFGAGLSLSPTTFLLGSSIDYAFDEQLSAGPAVQLGIGDDDTIFAPFGQVRYWPTGNLDRENKLKPFVQGGLGAVYMDRQHRGGDWGLLLNAGGGVRFNTGEGYRLGSTALFNFVPGEVADKSFYFTWEVLQVMFAF